MFYFYYGGVVNSLARSTTNGAALKAFARNGGEAVDRREYCYDVIGAYDGATLGVAIPLGGHRLGTCDA
jgi:hypothetical protein